MISLTPPLDSPDKLHGGGLRGAAGVGHTSFPINGNIGWVGSGPVLVPWPLLLFLLLSLLVYLLTFGHTSPHPSPSSPQRL
jgi:hypothetical protein